MALFRHLYGNKDDAPQTITHGYSYIMIDPEESAGHWGAGDANTYGLGEWVIDIKENDSDPGKRYRIAAARLVDDEGNVVEVGDMIQKTELTTELATQKDDARTALEVYSTDETYSQAEANNKFGTIVFERTLQNANWVAPSGAQTMYTYTITVNGLKCGYDGKVPPLINWKDLATRDEYYKIDYAEATPDDLTTTPMTPGYIVLYAKEKPVADSINITITDYR